MKSVLKNFECRPRTMSDRMRSLSSLALAATRLRIEKTRSASETLRVPSAESLRAEVLDDEDWGDLEKPDWLPEPFGVNRPKAPGSRG